MKFTIASLLGVYANAWMSQSYLAGSDYSHLGASSNAVWGGPSASYDSHSTGYGAPHGHDDEYSNPWDSQYSNSQYGYQKAEPHAYGAPKPEAYSPNVSKYDSHSHGQTYGTHPTPSYVKKEPVNPWDA